MIHLCVLYGTGRCHVDYSKRDYALDMKWGMHERQNTRAILVQLTLGASLIDRDNVLADRAQPVVQQPLVDTFAMVVVEAWQRSQLLLVLVLGVAHGASATAQTAKSTFELTSSKNCFRKSRTVCC